MLMQGSICPSFTHSADAEALVTARLVALHASSQPVTESQMPHTGQHLHRGILLAVLHTFVARHHTASVLYHVP